MCEGTAPGTPLVPAPLLEPAGPTLTTLRPALLVLAPLVTPLAPLALAPLIPLTPLPGLLDPDPRVEEVTGAGL